MVVTHKELVLLINGHNHEDKMTKFVMKTARENNLVIVSAIGDDTIQFDGAFKDEVDLFRGGQIFLEKDGIYTKMRDGRKVINVFWEENRLFLWKFLTLVPHSKFVIKKNNKNWCEGIVICLNDI